jgi:hypothetical protein
MSFGEFSDRALGDCYEPRSDFRTKTTEKVGTEPCWNVFATVLFDEADDLVVLVEVDDDD